MVSDEAGQVCVHLSQNLLLHDCHVFSANSSLCFVSVLVNKHFCQWLYVINVQKARISEVNFFELVHEAI